MASVPGRGRSRRGEGRSRRAPPPGGEAARAARGAPPGPGIASRPAGLRPRGRAHRAARFLLKYLFPYPAFLRPSPAGCGHEGALWEPAVLLRVPAFSSASVRSHGACRVRTRSRSVRRCVLPAPRLELRSVPGWVSALSFPRGGPRDRRPSLPQGGRVPALRRGTRVGMGSSLWPR